jgi:hypothetical protein
VNYDVDSDIVSLRVDIPVTERASFYADYTFMQTTGTMDAVHFAELDPAVAAVLTAQDMEFGTIHELSDVDVERDDFTVGFNLNTPQGFLFQVAYMWVDYEDNDPILTDESGEYDVIWASVGWRF